MPPATATIEGNVGLLDGRGCAQMLYTLGSRFHAVEFCDWTALAEEIVLRDQILISGKLERFPYSLQLALKPYIDAGIFRPLVAVYDLVDLPRDQRRIDAIQRAIADGLTATSVTDANFEVTRLLGAERFTSIPATPQLRNLQHYGLIHRPKVETAVWDLAGQYRDLAEAARECRQHAQQLANLPTVSVPPIALLALQRSRHFDQVLTHLLELREEFAPLRTSLRGLHEQLTSGQLTPQKVRTLEEDWRNRWQKLAVTLGGSAPNIMSIARTAMPMLKDCGKLITSTYKSDTMGAAEGALSLLSHTVGTLGNLKLRPVHRPVSNYLRTTDQHMLAAIARNFEHDFVLIDRDIHHLANHPANPWHRAIAASGRRIGRAA